jgi:hypothetical protein
MKDALAGSREHARMLLTSLSCKQEVLLHQRTVA